MPELRSVELRFRRVRPGVYFATTSIGVWSVELEVVRVAEIERSSEFGWWWWYAWEPDGTRGEGGQAATYPSAKNRVRDFFARRRGGEA